MSIRTCLAPLILVPVAAGCSIPEASTPIGKPSTSVPSPAKTTPPPGTGLRRWDWGAKRALETSEPGYCDVIFAVGDSVNVSVLALYLNDTPRACSAVDQAAAFIEPKLP